jgi:hypothetical protein
MNALGPPKETGALQDAPIPKLTFENYHRQVAAQAPVSWQREALRLHNEWRRTGQARHLAAYVNTAQAFAYDWEGVRRERCSAS